jgi:hypothetical protein
MLSDVSLHELGTNDWNPANEMRDAFEQQVNDVDGRKQYENDEEGAMVRVIWVL